MPLVYTACPQCERPIDLDLVRDAPAVACPCCDRRIEVPPDRLRSAPATVWLAAVLTALLPVSVVPFTVLYLPSEWYALAILAALIPLLPVAAAILLSRRWAWVVSLVLAGMGVLGGLGVGFLGVFYALLTGSIGNWLISFGTIVFVSGVLLLLLMVRGCRGWCDR